MSAVTAAIGYGIGLLIGWLLRSLIPWRPGPRLRRAARWALLAAAVVLIPLFGVLGAQWQQQIRQLVDITQESEASYILVPRRIPRQLRRLRRNGKTDARSVQHCRMRTNGHEIAGQ